MPHLLDPDYLGRWGLCGWCPPPCWGGTPGQFGVRGAGAFGASPWVLPGQLKWSRPVRHQRWLLRWSAALLEDDPSWSQPDPYGHRRHQTLWCCLPESMGARLPDPTGRWPCLLGLPLSPYPCKSRRHCWCTLWGSRGGIPPSVCLWGSSWGWGKWRRGSPTSLPTTSCRCLPSLPCWGRLALGAGRRWVTAWGCEGANPPSVSPPWGINVLICCLFWSMSSQT